MEVVERIELSHQLWQSCKLPLHHTTFKMVDLSRVELEITGCKPVVLPLAPQAHLKILHQYIVFVKSKIYPILSGSDSSGSDIQGCIVSLTLLDVSTQHAHHYKLVGDDGIEPPQADSKSAALPLCKSPVTKNGACGEV